MTMLFNTAESYCCLDFLPMTETTNRLVIAILNQSRSSFETISREEMRNL